MRIYLVTNDTKTGGAKLYTADFPDAVVARGTGITRVEKKYGENMPWHRPKKPTMLRITRGSHTVFVPVGSGEEQVTLQTGDVVLFLDHEVQKCAAPFDGHRSEPGPEGVEFMKTEFDTAFADMEAECTNRERIAA